jgi:DNA-binding winged helix-turn-helix (wHTH) protein
LGPGVKSMSTALAPKQSPSGGEDSPRVAGFPTRCVKFGVFELDLQRQELLRNGAPVKIQGKVYQALLALLENPGEIVTREMLRMRLWPTDTQLNYDANVNTTVNKLRQLLGDTNSESIFVETIPRKGYSFIAKVQYLAEPAASAARDDEARERTTSFLGWARVSMFLGADRARIWFTAGLIALLIAAMLFGAAMTLYWHRGF